MKLHQKIAKIRREKGLTIKALHHKLREIFKNKALSYRSLLRIEQGHTDARGSSLYQICLGLDLTMEELKKGTEGESDIADLVKRKTWRGRYFFNEKARAEILTGPKLRFLAVELTLEAGGKTNIEKDPEGRGNNTGVSNRTRGGTPLVDGFSPATALSMAP